MLYPFTVTQVFCAGYEKINHEIPDVSKVTHSHYFFVIFSNKFSFRYTVQ